MDEAGQAIEPDVLSAAEAAQARRCVLCGDPMQLPPTVLSAAGVEAGLASSPMERLLEVRDASVALRFLDEQRRMHPAISAFPNATYYGGRVRDAPRWSLDRARTGCPIPSRRTRRRSKVGRSSTSLTEKRCTTARLYGTTRRSTLSMRYYQRCSSGCPRAPRSTSR